MVGLVIVSHSRALADAVVSLILPMAGVDVPIAVAAGTGDDRSELGTDAAEISEAIQGVFSEAGVLVLMDLGSAVLSAETALDLLPPEMKALVRLCPGPLVEGSLAAAVQSGLGSDLERTCEEARRALNAKEEHLGEYAQAAGEADAESEAMGKWVEGVVLKLKNQHGLHARPAARFVQTAGRFNATVRVSNLTRAKGPVSAASLNDLATLGALRNHEIRVEARGPEAMQAVDALRSLVESNFGERLSQTAPLETTAGSIEGIKQADFTATPVSAGIAIGPIYHYQPPLPPLPSRAAGAPQQEWRALQRAIEMTRKVLEQRRRQVGASLGAAQAAFDAQAIFDAHLLILQDPRLLERTKQRIEAGGLNGAVAWQKEIEAAAAAYRALDDAYLQQRAADVVDVGNQVLFAMAGKAGVGHIDLPGPVILFAEELTPTETSQLELQNVLGIITVVGGGTSHSAILARARGIPAVSGVSNAVRRLKSGTTVALDGASGDIWVKPSEKTQAVLRSRHQAWREQREAMLEAGRAVTMTRDGQRVEVFANVGSVRDAAAALENGAEGVGLLRTEFLYLARQTPPDEAQQMAVLSEIAAVMGDRPVTVRTLDVGGDKEVPYLDLPREANPFLGVRAIRMSLSQPELFVTQLRAILRAGAGGRFRIMFPMVATIDEIWQAREWLEKTHLALEADEVAHAWPIETGIMVEIPSAALMSPVLAREVDFFSIGTNDLTQYTLAAERGSARLVSLADSLHPAVLGLIKGVTDAAHKEGKWVGVCGELAGDPEAAAVLVGLGVDELSLNPAGIPLIKQIVRGLETQAARALAEKILQTQNAVQARQLAREFLQGQAA